MQVDGIIFEFMPRWLELAVAGPLIVYFIAVAGIVATKAGRHPAWSLILLFPFVQVITVWAFALAKWPRTTSEE